MDNISSLKIAIDSSDAKKASNELNNLTNVSGKAEKTVNTLRNAFATIGAGALAKQFIDTSDSLKLLDARLKLATDSTKEFKSQQEQLLKISLQSYTAYSDTVTLFTKLNPALKQVGASTEQVNSVVSSFVKGLQLGGSSAAEASSAILQFSQAMGSGVLRGEEFNAIAEASPKLMSYLAKGMGVAQSELRKMAENGELTASRVSNALLKVKDTIDKDFATLPVTVGKAMTNLATVTGQMIQDIDKSLGATDALAGYINDLSNAINSLSPEELQQIVDLVKNSAIAFGTAAASITLAKGAILLFESATNGAFTATTLLKGALNTIPFAIIITGITAVATSLFSASESSETLEKTLKSTNEELKKLTKNQLAYRQELLEEEIVRSRLIMADAKARAGKSSANAEDKANRDEAIKNFEEQTKKLRELKELQKDSSLNGDGTSSTPTINADLKTKRNEVEIIKILGNEYQKFNLTLDEQSKKLKEQGATEKEINDFRANELKKFNEKQSESSKKTADEQKKIDDEAKQRANELSKAYLEISQIGMSEYDKSLVEIAEKTKEWIEAGVSQNDVLAVQKQLLEELNLQNSLSIASEQLSFLEKKAQLMTDEYEKSKLLLEIKYAQNMIDIQKQNVPIEDKQRLIEQETELYNLTKERLELDRNTEFQETMKSFQDDMIERQRELNGAIYEFGDSFEGAGNKISKVAKNLASFANAEIKAKKEREKIDKKYTEEFTKYAGDVEKTKELEKQYSEETAQINEMAISNQIDGYSNLAGAIAGLYEEGSREAEAFMIIQKALSIASGITAIASAMANGDGYTAVARGLAVAATLMSFGWGGSGGGSDASSGGSKQKESQFDIKEQEIEDLYTPMTDRLDRQIELLESIDKKGSASALSLEGSKIAFERDYALAVNSIIKGLPNDVRGYGLDYNQKIGAVESRLGFNIADVFRIKKSGWDSSEKRIYTDASSLSRGTNMIKLIADYFKTGDSAISALFGGNNALNQAANSIQKVIGEFTSGIVSSLDDITNASEQFKDIYDGITGTMYFENKRLFQAYKEIEKLTNGKNLATYLKENIDQIDFLNETFNESVVNTLLSQDPKDIENQIKVLEDLKVATGLVFENGARDALDFIDSIKLVGDAMVTSSENIRDFFDSFLNDIQKVEVMASKLGENVPKSMEELMNSFTKLSNDWNGLTDSELEYLSDAKELLNDQTETLIGSISELEDTASKLRTSVNGINSNSLDMFYQSMAKTQDLLLTGDYDAISKSISETIGLSSAVSDSKNFALSRDMQFAQLVAAKQFEDMKDTLKEDVDYLSNIETNTANTNTAITNLSEVMKAYLMGGTMPSFAVGTSYVSNDMTARIHQGEIITPRNFSDGLRNGDLVMGQTSGIINAISIMNNNFTQNVANLENKLNSIISLSNGQLNQLIDIRDINNESLVTLGNIEVII